MTRGQQVFFGASAASLLVVLWWQPVVALRVALLMLSVLSLLFTAFKVLLVQTSLGGSGALSVSEDELSATEDAELPVYTVLVPLYKEAGVLPELVASLGALEYPADRLEVLLLLEQDDEETIAAARGMALPASFRIVLVPPGTPRGKPRACNHGLSQCRGQYLVIYDAEDQPDPLQLRKALVAFGKGGARTVCVQSKLNYYNHSQNLLTRLFASEYSMWFDLFLPGLQTHRLPIPLGGTSNHFRVDALCAVGAWDAWNVTEDADLGLRLYKRGFRTVVLDSTTFEEATSRPRAWVHQRSRWIKGYVQTWLVHMRRPLRLWRELGPRGFVGFQLMYLGTFFTLLVNPVFWALALVWALGQSRHIDALFDGPLWGVAALSLYVGNFALIYMLMLGSLVRGRGELVKYGLLAPAYWVLMSIAAWKGTLQLVTRPSYWQKTTHGLFRRDPLSPLAAPVPVSASSSAAAAGPESVRAPDRNASAPAPAAAPATAASHLAVLWALCFTVMAGTGAFALHRAHLYEGEMLDRLHETVALMRSSATLASFPMELPPVPVLLLVPWVLSGSMVKLMLPGVLLSAAFAAGSVVLLEQILRGFGVERRLRVGMLVVYSCNPLVLAASINGTSDALVLSVLLLSLRNLQRLRFAPDGDRYGASLGILAAIAFLCRYQAVAWGPALLVAAAVTLAGAGRPRRTVQGHLFLGAMSFAYVVGVWLFFNYLGHESPFHFVAGMLGHGGPSARQDLPIAPTTHGPGGILGYSFTTIAWVLPGALLLCVLLIVRAVRRRDGFALALALLLVTPPVSQGILLRLGVQGCERLVLCALPAAFAAATYLMHRATAARRWALLSLLVASSVGTYAGMHRPDSPFQRDLRYVDMLVGRPVPGDLPEVQRLAEALESTIFTEQPRARVLVSEKAHGAAILLLSRRFDAFVTERSPDFDEILRAPVGRVDYFLVTEAELTHNAIDWAYPGIARRGAPFLQPVLHLPGNDGKGSWLYRVVAPTDAPPASPPAETSRWIPDGAFVRTEGTRFVIRPRESSPGTPGTVAPFRFVGANFRALQGKKERALYRETLELMAQDGLTVGRVWALGEGTPDSTEWQREHELFRRGPDDFIEESYRCLDRVLAAARQKGIRLILSLANNWPNYGGIPAYLEWAGIPEAERDSETFFRDPRVRRMYLAGVDELLSRTNSVTGVRYVDDPTIFAWELINEASCSSVNAHADWTREMAAHIKQRDPNHLVASGMINFESWRDWVQVNSLPQVDYVAFHLYPHQTQCSWRCVESVLSGVAMAMRDLGKPGILQELGFPQGERWEGETADVATGRMLTMALRSGLSGGLVWVYEPFFPHRQDRFGILVDRPDTDGTRAALRGFAEELRAGRPLAEPQREGDGRGVFPPPTPAEHTGWREHAGGQLLEVRPDHHQIATFSRRQGQYYLTTPVTHVFGEGAGRFGYRFAAPQREAPPRAFEVEARLSSEWEWKDGQPPPPGWTSRVRVLLDDQEIGRFEVTPDDRLGRVERVRVERPELLSKLSSGHHTLSFEALEGADAHGLCIYGLPAIGSGLDPAGFPPIRLRYVDGP